MKNYKIILLLAGFVLLAQTFFSCEDDDDPNPTLSITSISPDTARAGERITISGKGFAETASLNEVVFTGGAEGSVYSASSTSLVVTVPEGALDGPITVTVDDNSAVSPVDFILDTSETPLDAPEITTIDPTHGIINVSVTITGENFSNTSGSIVPSVFFGEVEAVINNYSATEIETTVPSTLPEGEVAVTVVREDETSGGVAFTVDPTPVAVKVCYWTTLSNEIVRGEITDDGVDIEVLYDSEDGVDGPMGIVMDTANNMLYWANYNSLEVLKAPIDGSGTVSVVYSSEDDIYRPYDLALDESNNVLYISNTILTGRNSANNYILKGDLNDLSSTPEKIYENPTSGVNNYASGIKLFISGGQLYWTEPFLTQVKSLDLGNSLAEVAVLFENNTSLSYPYGLALDLENSKIYILDNPNQNGISDQDAIFMGNLDGTGGLTEIVSAGDDLSNAWDMEIDLDNGYIFWINNKSAENGGGDIKRASLDGTTVETLFGGIDEGTYFVLDIR